MLSHRPEINYMLPIMPYATSRQFRVEGQSKNPSATYLASFSVTYLATSLKLAKFSVTERTAVVAV